MPTEEELLKEIADLKAALAEYQQLAKEHYEDAERLRQNALSSMENDLEARVEKAVQKKAGSLYRVPEAGSGKWRLEDIKVAFHAAWLHFDRPDLRRNEHRTRLENRRLVRELALYGQKITQGSAHTYSVFFDTRIVQRAVDHLRASGPAQEEADTAEGVEA